MLCRLSALAKSGRDSHNMSASRFHELSSTFARKKLCKLCANRHSSHKQADEKSDRRQIAAAAAKLSLRFLVSGC